MNKKASLPWNYIIIIILILLVIVWFSLWMFEQNINQNKFKLDVACKLSVKASAESQNPSLINCPRNYIKISNNNEKNMENAKYTIAQSLAICRNKYSKGTDELFQHIDSNFCGICDVFEFSDNKSISNFDDYIIDNKVNLLGVPKVAYVNYLLGTKMSLGALSSFKQNELNMIKLDSSKKYASVFIYSKDSFFFSKDYQMRLASEIPPPFSWALKIDAFFFGYSPGSDWISGILLIPFDENELKRKCKYLVG